MTDLSDATHTVIVYANDTAGNIGNSETVHFSVNVPPPNIVVIYPENRTYATNSVPLTFTINKPTSWIGYSLDGQANVTITENTTLASLLDGNHRVIIYANDTGGNMGRSDSIYFTTDTTPPDIVAVSQSPLEDTVLPDDEVMVNSTVLDPVSGVKRVSLNYTSGNGTWIEVEMVNIEGDVWYGLIPPFPYGTNITYIIAASDNMDNTISTEDLGYEYQYPVIPEFAPMIVLYLFAVASILALLTRMKCLRGKL